METNTSCPPRAGGVPKGPVTRALIKSLLLKSAEAGMNVRRVIWTSLSVRPHQSRAALRASDLPCFEPKLKQVSLSVKEEKRNRKSSRHLRKRLLEPVPTAPSSARTNRNPNLKSSKSDSSLPWLRVTSPTPAATVADPPSPRPVTTSTQVATDRVANTGESRALHPKAKRPLSTCSKEQTLFASPQTVHVCGSLLRPRDGSPLWLVLAVLPRTEEARSIFANLSKVCGLSGIRVEAPRNRRPWPVSPLPAVRPRRRKLSRGPSLREMFGPALDQGVPALVIQARSLNVLIVASNIRLQRVPESTKIRPPKQKRTINNRPSRASEGLIRNDANFPELRAKPTRDAPAAFRPAPAPPTNPWTTRTAQPPSATSRPLREAQRSPPVPPPVSATAGSSSFGDDIQTVMAVLARFRARRSPSSRASSEHAATWRKTPRSS
ncbi:hypothetical protein EVAR_80858_1 [Eumeta japonica]|uniref:Uncharacterized protein n=1 Tax=Eumeta variegata TaxID=151549 RepID=A0A4C1V1E6_EUMVA|nr:hypothetical protein EVAR_80858_1 [Eumeta japonica]